MNSDAFTPPSKGAYTSLADAMEDTTSFLEAWQQAIVANMSKPGPFTGLRAALGARMTRNPFGEVRAAKSRTGRLLDRRVLVLGDGADEDGKPDNHCFSGLDLASGEVRNDWLNGAFEVVS